mgnify:CR=1 FL=1
MTDVYVAGDAEDVPGEDDKFEVEYYGGSTFLVKAKAGAKLDTKTKNTLNLIAVLSDGENDTFAPFALKNFKPVATAPTFKVAQAVFTAADKNVSVNFTSTYKDAAKHQVQLMPNTLSQASNTDKFKAVTDESGNILIDEEGFFTVKPLIQKSGNFKVTAVYNFVNSGGEALDGSISKTSSVKLKFKK